MALVVGDTKDDVVSTLVREGWTPTRWDRRAQEGRQSGPWPSAGPYQLAAVRLPRSKEELDMTLHAVASVLAPSGLMLLYGANDEGIKSVARRLEPVFVDVQTVATGGHCRVLKGRLAENAELRPSLVHWEMRYNPELRGLSEEWLSYPGVFSHGSLDSGTNLLLGTLPATLEGLRVLDYGTGTGIIGGVCATRGAEVEMLDVDTVALAAAQLNVPGARLTVGTSLEATGDRTFDLIVSNPPIHRGKAETHDVLEALVHSAPGHLERRGQLLMVVQKRVSVEASLEQAFASIERVAEDGVFKVIRATVR